MDHRRRARMLVVAGFAGFGVAWGAWGAAVPAVREATGASQAELGTALLLVAAGAVPAMLAAPRALARYPRATLPITLALLGLAFAAVGAARDVTELAVALFVVGGASGMVDVAINTTGSRLETVTGRPLLQLGHGSFSAAVVVAALATGIARDAGTGPLAILGAVAVALSALALALGALPSMAPAAGDVKEPPAGGDRPGSYLDLVWALGLAAAVALMIENGFQSWSAEHVEESLHATATVGGTAAALFAAGAATGRFLAYRYGSVLGDPKLLGIGAGAGAAGAALTATAPSPWMALAGVALAGTGVSVIFPMLISQTGRGAAPGLRERAVARVTVLGYLGFLVSPPLMGLVAGLLSLRASFALLAALAALLALVGPTILRRRGRDDSQEGIVRPSG